MNTDELIDQLKGDLTNIECYIVGLKQFISFLERLANTFSFTFLLHFGKLQIVR